MTSLPITSKKPDLIKSFTEIQPIADMGKGSLAAQSITSKSLMASGGSRQHNLFLVLV